MEWLRSHLRLPRFFASVREGVGFPASEVDRLSEVLRTSGLFEDRGKAALRLGASVHPDATNQLIETARSDPDLGVRRVALWSLGSLVQEENGRAAKRLIRPSLRRIGAEACSRRMQSCGDQFAVAFCDLCTLLGPKAKPGAAALRTLALSGSEEIAECAVRALESVAPKSAHQYFLKKLNKDYGVIPDSNVLRLFRSEHIRASILKVLGRWIDAPARYVGGYAGGSGDGTSKIVLERAERALTLLKDMRPVDGLPLLLNALSHRHVVVSRQAIDLVSTAVRAGQLSLGPLLDKAEGEWARRHAAPGEGRAIEALAHTLRPEAFPLCLRVLAEPTAFLAGGSLALIAARVVERHRDLIKDQDRLKLLRGYLSANGYEGEIVRETLIRTMPHESCPRFSSALVAGLVGSDVSSEAFDDISHLLQGLPSHVSLLVLTRALASSEPRVAVGGGDESAVEGSEITDAQMRRRVLKELHQQCVVRAAWESRERAFSDGPDDSGGAYPKFP